MQDAFLDVWAYGIAEFPDLLVDLTVRHPTCDAYMPNAAATTGYAAAHAENEKVRRYPPSRGRCVVPLAHETFGRLAPHAEDLMSRCAAVATRLAHRQWRLPPCVLRNWRARLYATLARGIAMQLHVCFNGTPGAAPFRTHRRLPPATLEARCPL
mgnify:CR=1 FL=1